MARLKLSLVSLHSFYQLTQLQQPLIDDGYLNESELQEIPNYDDARRAS